MDLRDYIGVLSDDVDSSPPPQSPLYAVTIFFFCAHRVCVLLGSFIDVNRL